MYLRLLIALPSGLAAGIGLIGYSKTVRSFSRKVSNHFILAGSSMIFYACVTGAVPTHEIVPVIGGRVILLRGFCAFFITYSTIKALALFSLEQREVINERLLRFSQSEKMTSLGILAAGIAHEINNPLTNVSLNVEMLKEQLEGDKGILKKLDAIERNIERASKIAKELLHFSRDKETALESTDINRIVSSSHRLLQIRN